MSCPSNHTQTHKLSEKKYDVEDGIFASPVSNNSQNSINSVNACNSVNPTNGSNSINSTIHSCNSVNSTNASNSVTCTTTGSVKGKAKKFGKVVFNTEQVSDDKVINEIHTQWQKDVLVSHFPHSSAQHYVYVKCCIHATHPANVSPIVFQPDFPFYLTITKEAEGFIWEQAVEQNYYYDKFIKIDCTIDGDLFLFNNSSINVSLTTFYLTEEYDKNKKMNIAKFRPAKIFSYTQHIAVQKQIQMYKDMSSVYQTTESGEVKRKIENEGDIEFVKSVSNMSDKDLSHYNKVVLSLAAVVDQNGNHQALNAMLLIEVLAF